MMEEEVGVTVEHMTGMAEDEHELVLVLVSVLVAADMADIVAAVDKLLNRRWVDLDHMEIVVPSRWEILETICPPQY